MSNSYPKTYQFIYDRMHTQASDFHQLSQKEQKILLTLFLEEIKPTLLQKLLVMDESLVNLFIQMIRNSKKVDSTIDNLIAYIFYNAKDEICEIFEKAYTDYQFENSVFKNQLNECNTFYTFIEDLYTFEFLRD